MNAECDFRPIGASESKTVSSVVPRVVRLTLAVFIALVALVCLCDRLSMARRQKQASYTAAVGQPTDGSECTLCETTQGVPANCQQPALSATKQVTPPNPDTGTVVTITFTITGLGLKRLDVVLVQDVSGSMDERDTPSGRWRLEVAQEAAITFVRQLSDTDRAGVVAYNDTAWLVQPLTTDKGAVISAINGLPSPDRQTNIGAGIQAGYTELITDNWRPKAIKAMILLSDGDANEPSNDPGGYARDRARAAGECGIMIYTIGLGDGVNETLMRDIADFSGGEYYFSPNGENLATIYQEIALALRNVVITDVLPPGVDVDCSLFPPGMCSQEDGLTTTIVISTSDEDLITDPLTLSFTATVNLDPPNQDQINVEGSGMCYDGPGGQRCPPFDNPTVTVGGRKVTGVVFEDLDLNGKWEVVAGEKGLPSQTVSTSVALTVTTSPTGFYVLRTSEDPALIVTVERPPGYIVTTPPTTIDPISGTYPEIDIGLYTGLFPEKRSRDINGPPLFEGDTLAYVITVRNISTTQRSGFIVITDAIPAFTTISGTARIEPSGTVTIAGRTLIASFTGTLAPKGVITLTFRVTVDEWAAGQTISNEVHVTSTLQACPLRRPDEEGPHLVESLPTPFIDLAASAQVVRPGTEFLYVYTVSHNSPYTLTSVTVTDSLVGPISPVGFPLLPGMTKALTASFSLSKNTTNTATVTCGVEGYSGVIIGDPATATVYVIEGISLAQVYTYPPPVYHGDFTTLYYSVTNQDEDDGVVSGTVLIEDSLSRSLDEKLFVLDPGQTIAPTSPPFSVPRDIVITLTAIAWDAIQQALPVSDQVTLTLCPKDVYEPDDSPGGAYPIYPGVPQLHDFYKGGDVDWVGLRLHPPDEALYVFSALPLGPNGVRICIDLYQGGTTLTKCNDGDHKSPVTIMKALSCTGADVCDYFVRVYPYPSSPASGCWTDYELSVREITNPQYVYLPLVLKDS